VAPQAEEKTMSESPKPPTPTFTPAPATPATPTPPPLPRDRLVDRVAALEDQFTEWQRRYTNFVGDVTAELGL
jgi:hypothetical protein